MNCNLVKQEKQRRKQKKNVTFRPVQINQTDMLDILTIIKLHISFYILYFIAVAIF